MEMRIETSPAYTVAYIRYTGPYGPVNAQTMDALKIWAESNRLLGDESIILGIAQDDPPTTAPEDCRYDACLVLGQNTPIHDKSIHMGSVTGGRYAIFTIPHTPEAVYAAWREAIPELQRQGYQPDLSRPIMERYAARLVQAHLCEICVPVH